MVKAVAIGRQPRSICWCHIHTAINLYGADVNIREASRAGLSQHEVAVGEVVGFIDNEHQQLQGKITRLNDKTVKI